MRSDQVLASPDDMAAAYRAEMSRLLDAVDRIPADLQTAPIHGDWTIKEVLVLIPPGAGRPRANSVLPPAKARLQGD